MGENGRVITIEIDEETSKFAQKNFERLRYDDILVVLGDGSLGYDQEAPYDKICVTAACPKILEPLIAQLRPCGRLAAPVGHRYSQDLVLLEKCRNCVKTKTIDKVLFVLLRGRYGWQM